MPSLTTAPRRAPIAKIAAPRPADVYPRERLFRVLDDERLYPVIWITGLPGTGKTSLAASYLRARKLPSLWYQVDEGDGDVATLFHYLRLAAHQAAPGKRTPPGSVDNIVEINRGGWRRRFHSVEPACANEPVGSPHSKRWHSALTRLVATNSTRSRSFRPSARLSPNQLLFPFNRWPLWAWFQ